MPLFPNHICMAGCILLCAAAMESNTPAWAQEQGDHPTPQPISIALTLQARELGTQGQFVEAIKVGNQALQQAMEDWGKESEPVAVIHGDLATLHMSAGHKTEGLRHLRKAYAMLINVCGEDHRNTVLVQGILGDLLVSLGQFEEAIGLLQVSVKRTAKIYGEDSVEVLTRTNRLGCVFTRQKNHDRAIEVYWRALQIAANVPNCPASELALTHNNLGEALSHRGDLPLARNHLEQALELVPKDEASAPLRAATLQNLGYLCRLQHEYVSAMTYYLDALETLDGIVPAGDAKRGRLFNNIGAIDMLNGDQERAQKHLLLALKILMNSPDCLPWESANTLSLLSESYFKQRNMTQAARFNAAALNIRKKHLGPNHPDSARCVYDAAILSTYLNQPENAKQLFADALHILVKTYGDQHLTVGNMHLGAGIFSESQRDTTQAFLHFDTAQRTLNSNVRLVLPGLSRREQLHYGVTVAHSLQKSLSFAVRNSSHPHVARSSWEWLINLKAIREEATAFQNQLRQIGARGSVAAERLTEIRQQLAQLALTNSNVDDGRHAALNASSINYNKLIAEEGQLERRIATESGLRTLERRWITAEHVAEHLQPKQALVDFFKVEMNLFDNKTLEFRIDSPRYAAWVVSFESQEARLFDLGDAATIEKAIQVVLRQLKSDSQPGAIQRDGGETVVSKRIQAQLQQLAQLIYHPLLASLGESEELILSPDADLWLIPWAALPELSPDELLIEKRGLRFVNSSRNLLPQAIDKNTAPPIGPAAIFADPNFDASPSTDSAAIRPNTGTKASQRSASKSLLIPTPGERWLPKFPRLEETAMEARSIEATLAQSHQKPLVFMHELATESNVKQLSAPDLLYFGTHGFIKFTLANPGLNKDDLWLSSSNESAWNDSVDHDPLMTCGLALSGCNTQPTGPTVGEDGILTGYEILGLNLRGTRLVVTAACETGLGQLRAGDGVACLRQAFQLAGAQSVVSTLWQVSNVDTSELMTAFFEHMSSGQQVSQALRSAQLDVINQRRRITGAAHPYFWAGVTVTGRE